MRGFAIAFPWRRRAADELPATTLGSENVGDPSLRSQRPPDVDEFPTHRPATSGRLRERGVVLACAFALLSLVVLKAWITEDAYITFRTIDNFVHGYGLRWNIAERVQTYTHPLWLFIVAAGYAVTREAYATTLVLSSLLTLATALVFAFRCGLSVTATAFGLVLLGLSDSFTSYSTSGLENPLVHLLLVVFVAALSNDKMRPDRQALFLSLLASLIAMTRLDALLLALPALVMVGWRGRGRVVIPLLLGTLPFFLWECFALLYYGSPFPNTAYAKLLGPGLSGLELGRLGLRYLHLSGLADPITLIVLASGITAGLTGNGWQRRVMGLGVVLQVLYVVRVGGDYMRAGRFLSAPFVFAAFLCADAFARLARWQRTCVIGALALYAGVGAWQVYRANEGMLLPPLMEMLASTEARDGGDSLTSSLHAVLRARHQQLPGDNLQRSDFQPPQLMRGEAWLNSCTITSAFASPVEQDEIAVASLVGGRRFSDVREQTVTHSVTGERCQSWNRWMYEGLRARDAGVHIVQNDDIGVFGYFAGPAVHIVDDFALSDAFLARLPPLRGSYAIGHFNRVPPQGYIESLESGRNRIREPALRSFFDAMTLITRGPLLSLERLAAIVALNVGRYDDLLASYEQNPAVALSRIAGAKPEFGASGILIDLERRKGQFDGPFTSTSTTGDDDGGWRIDLRVVPLDGGGQRGKWSVTYYSVGFRNEYTQAFGLDDGGAASIPVPGIVAALRREFVVLPPFLHHEHASPRSLLYTHLLIRPESPGRYRLESVGLFEP